MSSKILTLIFCLLAFFSDLKAQLGFLKEGKFDYYEFFEELDLLDAKLYAEDETIEPGKPFYLLIHLKVAPDWRSPWINPGDLGTPSQLQWLLPKGFEILSVQWPYPSKFEEEGKTLFAYEGDLALLALIQAPKNLKARDSLDLGVKLHWFLCKDKCVPGLSELKISMPVKNQAAQKNSSNSLLFAMARERIPQKAWHADLKSHANELCLRFSQEGQISKLLFFPQEEGIIDRESEVRIERDGSIYSLYFQKGKWFDENKFQNLKGVLTAEVDDKASAFFIDLPVSGPWLEAKSSQKESSFLIKDHLNPFFSLSLIMLFVLGLCSNFLPAIYPLSSMLIMHAIHLSKQSFKRQISYALVLSVGAILAVFSLFSALPILEDRFLSHPIFILCLSFIYLLNFLALAQIFPSRLLAVSGKYAPKQVPSLFTGLLAPSYILLNMLPFGIWILCREWQKESLEYSLLYFSGLFTPALLAYFFGIYWPLLVKPGRWMLFMRQWNVFYVFSALILLYCQASSLYSSFAQLYLAFALLVFSLSIWIFMHWTSRSKLARAGFVIISLFFLLLSSLAAYKFLNLTLPEL